MIRSTSSSCLILLLLLVALLSELRSAEATDHSSPCVKSGPFQKERTELFAKIQDANTRGIGIKAYLTAFQQIETMIETGEPPQKINEKLDTISDSLDEQLGSLQCAHVSGSQMSLNEARRYVLEVINSERLKLNLSPLKVDSIATSTGQTHSDEMATLGYCSHWDISGKKPDLRYTEFGGADAISENVGLTSSARTLGVCKLTNDNVFIQRELLNLHTAFMREKPPNDLHRAQILTPVHNKCGIGLSYATGTNGQWRLAICQEFIDSYGDFAPLPTRLRRGQSFRVSGRLSAGARLSEISIKWESQPKSMTIDELRKTGSYGIPEEEIISFSPEITTDKSLRVWFKNGFQNFSVDVTPKKQWKSGVYYFLIWATLPNDKLVLVSTRAVSLL